MYRKLLRHIGDQLFRRGLADHVGDDPLADIQQHHECWGHYHTGGVPGRNEIDDTQEIKYPPIMKAIVETGFKGHVAQEFIPAKKPPLDSLRAAVKLAAVRLAAVRLAAHLRLVLGTMQATPRAIAETPVRPWAKPRLQLVIVTPALP